MFFDCCKAYYIVMQAIIESGYRTQIVQLFKDIFKRNEKNKVKLFKNKIMFSDIEDIPMIMLEFSLSDLLTLSQVWNTPSRNLNFDWDSVSRPQKLKLERRNQNLYVHNRKNRRNKFEVGWSWLIFAFLKFLKKICKESNWKTCSWYFYKDILTDSGKLHLSKRKL